MNEINNILSGNADNDKAIQVMDELFEVLKVHCKNFGYVLAHQIDPDFCKREWVKTFKSVKMTLKRIQFGIDRLRDKGFDRMIYPSDFIKLSQPLPEDVGAPSIDAAFKNAVSNSLPHIKIKDWHHVTVHYAFIETTSWALSHQPEKTIKPVFEAHYLQGCLLFAENKLNDLIAKDDKNQEKHENDRKEYKNNIFEFKNGNTYLHLKDKEHWQPGYIFLEYENLNSRDKAIPVVYKYLDVLGKKNTSIRSKIKSNT